MTETVGLLAARAPKLRPALRAARAAGHAFVVDADLDTMSALSDVRQALLDGLD